MASGQCWRGRDANVSLLDCGGPGGAAVPALQPCKMMTNYIFERKIKTE